jgi:GNAT superfamily N-acetyltransferase
MPKFTFKEVAPELWDDFEKLFGDNGACGGCWCQSWRIPHGGKIWNETKGAKAKRLTKALFKAGKMTGLLAYDGDKPVAWCSYGPREVFPRIETAKAYQQENCAGVWSINCFFIDKHYRKQGLSGQMLDAALKFLKKRKVKLAEGYPVPLTKAGKELPATFVWTGPLKIFEQAGFEIVQRVSYSRPLVQKKL